MVTLSAYRQALLLALGDGAIYSIVSSTATTAVIGGLIDSSSNASTHRYDRHWIHAPTATGVGQTRIIKSGGYVASTGTVTIQVAWGLNPTPGAPVEITSLFPAEQDTMTDETSYRTLVNRALGRMLMPDRLSLAITTADSYDISAYQAWLDRPERLARVLEPAVVSGRQPTDAAWRGWQLVLNAELPLLTLDTPFASATGSMTLEVLRPASTWIESSGTWAESTVGLANDTDEAKPPIEDFLPFGLMEACAVLMKRSRSRPSGDWATLYAEARDTAKNGRYWDHTSERPEPMPQQQEAA